MPQQAKSTTNWFDRGGRSYAQFRPTYPADLAPWLAGLAPDRGLAVDVGCGNGQLTTRLAAHFDRVTGIDPSADQLANAAGDARIDYLCAPAERLPLPDGCASLITAAQAAHWFDLPAFYAEARRIAKPGAVIALISYGVLELASEPLHQRFIRFYRDEIGPYWPPERGLVDSGYAGIAFPFDELDAPALAIRLNWDFDAFLGYLSTWSSLRKAQEAGRPDIAEAFIQDLSGLWTQPVAVTWPINMRVGRI
ncbi:class I SAM-dependent methyltransferase [Paracoccus marinaquae]|uniref:Methyltransferase domain-containing protein n=1 Tax=Paracoccus marinaquae TaxID=2841926 RepID=A0ABS6AIW8_9RHOB|nr:class I SAM-dependent methyltransferase [Paracoccus marinaquae]MBU3029842.1 methyltransferase domain-containing protein [Paracoccus marinaquae]